MHAPNKKFSFFNSNSNNNQKRFLILGFVFILFLIIVFFSSSSTSTSSSITGTAINNADDKSELKTQKKGRSGKTQLQQKEDEAKIAVKKIINQFDDGEHQQQENQELRSKIRELEKQEETKPPNLRYFDDRPKKNQKSKNNDKRKKNQEQEQEHEKNNNNEGTYPGDDNVAGGGNEDYKENSNPKHNSNNNNNNNINNNGIAGFSQVQKDPYDGEQLVTTHLSSPLQLLPVFRSHHQQKLEQQQQQQQQNQSSSSSSSSCCTALENAAETIFSVPSDQDLLFPTLSLYFRESEHMHILDMAVIASSEKQTEEILGICFDASGSVALLESMAYSPEKKFSTILFYGESKARLNANIDSGNKKIKRYFGNAIIVDGNSGNNDRNDFELNRTLPFDLLYSCEKKCRNYYNNNNGNNKSSFGFVELYDADLSGYVDFRMEPLWFSAPFYSSSTFFGNKQHTHHIDVLYLRNSFLSAESLTKILETFRHHVKQKIIIYNVFETVVNPSVPYSIVNSEILKALLNFLSSHYQDWEEESTLMVNRGMIVLSRRKLLTFDHNDKKGYFQKWVHSDVPRYSGFSYENDLEYVKKIVKEVDEGIENWNEREHHHHHHHQNQQKQKHDGHDDDDEKHRDQHDIQETEQNVTGATTSTTIITIRKEDEIEIEKCKNSFRNMSKNLFSFFILDQNAAADEINKNKTIELNLQIDNMKKPCAYSKFTKLTPFASISAEEDKEGDQQQKQGDQHQQQNQHHPIHSNKHTLERLFHRFIQTPENILPIRYHLGAILSQVTSTMSILYFHQQIAIHKKLAQIQERKKDDPFNDSPAMVAYRAEMEQRKKEYLEKLRKEEEYYEKHGKLLNDVNFRMGRMKEAEEIKNFRFNNNNNENVNNVNNNINRGNGEGNELALAKNINVFENEQQQQQQQTQPNQNSNQQNIILPEREIGDDPQWRPNRNRDDIHNNNNNMAAQQQQRELQLETPETNPEGFKLQPVNVFVWGCELSVFASVAHGVSSLIGNKLGANSLTFLPFEYSFKHKNLLDTYRVECPLHFELDEFLKRHMLTKRDTFPFDSRGKRPIDVLVVSAKIVEEIGKNDPGRITEIANAVKSKIIIYGTSLSSIAAFDKGLTARGLGRDGFFVGFNVFEEEGKMNSFELKVNHASSVGLAVYERHRDLSVKLFPEGRENFLEYENRMREEMKKTIKEEQDKNNNNY